MAATQGSGAALVIASRWEWAGTPSGVSRSGGAGGGAALGLDSRLGGETLGGRPLAGKGVADARGALLALLLGGGPEEGR